MLVLNDSPLPVFFVLGILIFFGSDLRYDSLIWYFHCSTHLQRSWSIEAVHCVKVRGVMVVVPVVLLTFNMIFIPAVKKNGSCSTQHVFILLKLHRTPPCPSGSQWQISMAKIPFKLPFRIFGRTFGSKFLLNKEIKKASRRREERRWNRGDAGPLVNWKSKGARSLTKSPGSNTWIFHICKILPFGRVFGVKRHTFYTLGRSRYSWHGTTQTTDRKTQTLTASYPGSSRCACWLASLVIPSLLRHGRSADWGNRSQSSRRPSLCSTKMVMEPSPRKSWVPWCDLWVRILLKQNFKTW